VKEHSQSVDTARTFLFVERKGKNNTGCLPGHCLDTDFSHRFDFDNAEVLCSETNWGKRLKKKDMYIALVENTCNTQKGRDLNPIWLPLLNKAFFIDGFLGLGTGTLWWLFFSLCHDRGKYVIS